MMNTPARGCSITSTMTIIHHEGHVNVSRGRSNQHPLLQKLRGTTQHAGCVARRKPLPT